MHAMTPKALADSLVCFAKAHGFRGLIIHIDVTVDYGWRLLTTWPRSRLASNSCSLAIIEHGSQW
jgi:hypothetical protein